MSDSVGPCRYCSGIRLVGWSGAGPILCPECSAGKDAFTVVTRAWREQRQRVLELEGYIERLHRQLDEARALLERLGDTEGGIDYAER